jgi:hypothetical protein
MPDMMSDECNYLQTMDSREEQPGLISTKCSMMKGEKNAIIGADPTVWDATPEAL